VNLQLHEQVALLDKATDAIVLRSLDDRVLIWNSSAERIYGYTAAEMLGQIITLRLYRDHDPL